MSTLVNQLTVEEAHKEFTPWWTKFWPSLSSWTQENLGQLAPQHLMLNALNWLSCFLMSQLCQRLYLPVLAHLYRLPFFKH